MDVNSRIKQIESVDEFIKEKQNMLNNILDSIGWTQESLKDEVKVCCPVNSGHWIPESALPHHIESCEWVENGYLKEELKKQPPDSHFFYEKSSNVIPVFIDHTAVKKVLSESSFIKDFNTSLDIPKTGDRWTVNFNPEQRLALYDYIVESSKASEKTKDVTLEDLMINFEKKEDQEEKPKSELEILAEMRDYKRRRQSYRAKNVHITKKSYTEIMKEVIENQTNYLAETRKHDSSDNSRRDWEDSNVNKNKFNHEADNYASDSSKFREHSGHREERDDSRKRHSRHESSKAYSPKRKKHKRDRSKSRSPTRHKHKKSHKRKRSRD